ncbi:MAG: DUF6106 family protein [Oscillospiraceae bacterium]
MDVFAEQLVKKEKSTADYIKMGGIAAGAIVLASLFMFLAMTMLFSFVIPAVLVLFLGVWLLGGTNVEYEYIITNNEMDIDKIIGKRKRKRMITIDLSKGEDFGAYPPEEAINAEATVHASSGLEKDAHYLVVKHETYGTVNVIFNPNEKIREAIMQELPNSLRIKIKRNVK